MWPEVKINIQTGNLGRIDDLGNGVPGIIVLMASSPTGHAFGAVKSYTRFADLPTELKAVEALKLYFAVAEGYKIHIMPVVNTTVMAEALDPADDTPYAKTLIEAGQGEIRFIGIVGTLLLAAQAATITKAQTLRTTMLASKNPVRSFIPYSYRTADTIPNLLSGSSNGVGVVNSYAGDEIGLLLGKLASSPVHRHPGRVKDGSVPVTSALLDGAASVKIEDNPTKVKELNDKGFITLGTHIGKSGYYFMGMPMATAATDDYATIANCRVIDKAYVVAYQTYLNELNEEVYVTSDGKLEPGYVKSMQAMVEKAIDLQMGANGEISGRKAYFDDQQNVVSTSKVAGSLAIQPAGYSSVIEIDLGLTLTIE